MEFGEAHVVIRPPIQGVGYEDLVQKPLFINHTGLYASKGYLKEFGTPKEAKDLDDHKLIAYGDHV